MSIVTGESGADIDAINQVLAEAEAFKDAQDTKEAPVDADTNRPVLLLDDGREWDDLGDDEGEYGDEYSDGPDYLAFEDTYGVDGSTKAVSNLARSIAEARRLRELQDDSTRFEVDSKKVDKARRRIFEHARLYEVAQNPGADAYRTSRVMRTVRRVLFAAMVFGLGWSATGVQHTAADGANAHQAAYWLAWFVDLSISSVVLACVFAKSHLSIHGQPLDSKVVTRIEVGALGLTLLLNIWPHLPGVAARFSMVQVILHTVGPLIAVAALYSISVLTDALAKLHRDSGAKANALRVPTQGQPRRAGSETHWTGSETQTTRGNARTGTGPVRRSGRPRRDRDADIARVLRAVENGVLSNPPTASQVMAALNPCGKGAALDVIRDMTARGLFRAAVDANLARAAENDDE